MKQYSERLHDGRQWNAHLAIRVKNLYIKTQRWQFCDNSNIHLSLMFAHKVKDAELTALEIEVLHGRVQYWQQQYILPILISCNVCVLEDQR